MQCERASYFTSLDRFLRTRVKAQWAELVNPNSYEALHYDETTHEWRWQREQPPDHAE